MFTISTKGINQERGRIFSHRRLQDQRSLLLVVTRRTAALTHEALASIKGPPSSEEGKVIRVIWARERGS